MQTMSKSSAKRAHCILLFRRFFRVHYKNRYGSECFDIAGGLDGYIPDQRLLRISDAAANVSYEKTRLGLNMYPVSNSYIIFSFDHWYLSGIFSVALHDSLNDGVFCYQLDVDRGCRVCDEFYGYLTSLISLIVYLRRILGAQLTGGSHGTCSHSPVKTQSSLVPIVLFLSKSTFS